MARYLGGLLAVLTTFLSIVFMTSLLSDRAAAAAPPPEGEMQFVVVRGATRLCKPACPQWIWASGKIVGNSPGKLRALLKKVGDRRLPIIISSHGGDVDGAVEMGRLIRKEKLDIAVGRTTFISCEPEAKGCDAESKGGYVGVPLDGWGFCESACPFVLSGGIKRLAGAWATVGVHQITTTWTKEKVFYRTDYKIVNGKKKAYKKIVKRQVVSSYKTTKLGKQARRKLEGYLDEMQVSTTLLKYLGEKPPSDLLWLSRDEMIEIKLTTSLESLNALAFPTVCKTDSDFSACGETMSITVSQQ